jgi:hypothetical protein
MNVLVLFAEAQGMAVVIGLSLGLIVAGLIMVWLSSGIKQVSLGKVVYWVGIALVVIGLILLLTPVLVWVNTQLRSMLGS